VKRSILLLPFVLLISLGVMRYLLGPRLGLLPMMVLAPPLAALVAGQIKLSWNHHRAIYIAAAGIAAVFVSWASQVLEGVLRPTEITSFVSIAAVTAVSLMISYHQRRTDIDLAHAQLVADIVQGVILRPVPARAGPVRLTARCVPSEAGTLVGGDFYEVVTFPDRVRLVMGDVQGKGLAAVQITALALGIFREAAFQEYDVAAVAARMDARLQDELADEQFVTAVLADIYPACGKAQIISCGHPPPLLLSPDGAKPATPEDPGLPLGLGLGDDLALAHMVPFAPGQALLFYTDGVSEARDSSGEFFPLAVQAGRHGATGLVDRLVTEVVGYRREGSGDDMALLLAHHDS
jgi:serine phosphatase RsbU (regulator of sigma subunit)